jgi:hypothetical protein
MAEATTRGRERDGRFAAGNPGRPRGARHKTTVAAEKLLDGEAKALTRKAIELAKSGDSTALRLCLDRIAPARRGRTMTLPGMPKVQKARDVPPAIAFILDAVAAGEITTDEAGDLTAILDRYTKAVETTELEERLAQIEQRLGE